MFKRIKNFFICLKYPFYKLRNVWTDEFIGYGHILYEEIPYGWRKAFGKQFSRDLRKALIKDKYLKQFRFTQIKEKYGQLCLYNSGVCKNSKKIIDYYELLSLGYCWKCGKPVRYRSRGWVEYLCEDCFNKQYNYLDEQIKKQHRINEHDIPHFEYFDSKQDKFIIIDYKKEYGIDFKELWGIEETTK